MPDLPKPLAEVIAREILSTLDNDYLDTEMDWGVVAVFKQGAFDAVAKHITELIANVRKQDARGVCSSCAHKIPVRMTTGHEWGDRMEHYSEKTGESWPCEAFSIYDMLAELEADGNEDSGNDE